MKTVLITGAGGFLGTHLMSHHLDAGDIVMGVDNHISSDGSAKHNVAMRQRLREQANGNFYVVDICDAEALKARALNFISYNKAKAFDIIYNFACPASPPIYQKHPIETMMTCVVGTKNVLDLATKNTVVVQASTSEVYGDPVTALQVETDRGNVNPYGPRACYDEGKRAAEALCFDYLNEEGTDARLVRIFNTYGPCMSLDDGRVITNMIKQALAGEPLTIYGNGEQTRSFCYVTDLVNAIVAMGKLQKNPGTPINIGNDREFTINTLADVVATAVARETGSAIVTSRENRLLPTDDPRQRRPDLTKAREILKYSPQVQLEEGIQKTVRYVLDEQRTR